MATTDDLTTLVCLFHHQDQAQAAIRDLLQAGVPQSSISVTGGQASQGSEFSNRSLEDLGVPARDLQHLNDGVRDGGLVVAVSAISDHVDKVEDVFEAHKAHKIDEATMGTTEAVAAPMAAAAMPLATGTTQTSGEAAIPIVEEELVVGKRAVNQGGVRVYRRIVEIPVEESVQLREEHIHVERRPVDRAVTNQDLAMADRTVELTETAEEAVVGKDARVVEEVRLGKDMTERTERIHDTVRKTEVEIEEITATDNLSSPSRNSSRT